MKTGVVLINWNNVADTLDCIASLQAGSHRPDKILVWDNGSSGNDASRIKNRYPGTVMCGSPGNLGFAEANNRAAHLLLRQGMEAIWILNNDTVVDRQCLERLLCVLDARPDAAAVTGKIFYAAVPEKIWYAGGHVNPRTLAAVHDGAGEIEVGRNDCERRVDFITGCCMLVRAGTVLQAGLFNSAYFGYCEDLDFSLRLRGLGLNMYYSPDAHLLHKVSASVKINDLTQGRCSPMQHYLGVRNQLFVIRTHSASGFRASVAIACCLAPRGAYAAVNALRGRLDKAGSFYKGVLEGFGPLPPAVTPAGGRSAVQ